MIAVYENIKAVNTKDGEQLLKLMDKVDSRTNGHGLAINDWKW